MKKTLSIFAAAVLLSAACTTEELRPMTATSPVDGITEFTAETESATKVTFGSDLSVAWAAHDSITVFSSGKKSKFYTDAAGTSSTFTIADGATPLSDTTAFFAGFPSTAGWSLSCDEGSDTLSVTLPNLQFGVKDGINPQYLLMAARSNSTTLAMKNLVALLKIELSDDNVTSVNINAKGGAKISGLLKFDISSEEPSVLSASASNVMLLPSSGESFESGVYYIAVAPAAISDGFEIVLMNKDDTNLGIKSSATSCTLARNHVLNMTDVCGVVDWEPTTVTGLTFWQAPAAGETKGTFLHPFTTPTSDEMKYSSSVSKAPTGFLNEEITCVATDANGGFTYKMFTKQGYWSNSSQGLRAFHDAGDYIEFPALGGLTLKAVRWTFGGAGLNNYPGFATASGDFVCGGEPFEASVPVGTPVVWTNLNAAENTAYRVTPHTSDNVVSCRKIELFYTGTPVPLVMKATTGAASNVTGTGATLNGTFVSFGSSDVASDFECGFEYKTGAGEWTSVSAATAALSFTADVTGLTEGSEYTYRAWAKANGGEKVYGAESTFTPNDLTVVTLSFWNFTTHVFSNPFAKATSLPSSAADGYNLDVTLTPSADNTYSYHFHSATSTSEDSAKSTIVTNTKVGLKVNSCGLSGDCVPTYMSIPVVPGKRLVSVTIAMSGYCNKMFIASDVTNGTKATDTKLDNYDIPAVSGAAQTAEITNSYSFKNAVAGTQYYLVFSAGTYQSKYASYAICKFDFSYAK